MSVTKTGEFFTGCRGAIGQFRFNGHTGIVFQSFFDSIEVIKSARVRRSKLYYLRSIVGKGSRLKERFKTK